MEAEAQKEKVNRRDARFPDNPDAPNSKPTIIGVELMQSHIKMKALWQGGEYG